MRRHESRRLGWWRGYVTNQRNDIDILRRRMNASVLLVKALGGGWEVEDLPKP